MIKFLKRMLIRKQDTKTNGKYNQNLLHELSEEDEKVLVNIHKEFIKKFTKKAYVVETSNSYKPGKHTGTRIGGIPYIDDRSPKFGNLFDSGYTMIAQVNLAELRQSTSLPKEGILQFYVHLEENYGFCVYIDNVDYNQNQEDVIRTHPNLNNIWNEYKSNSGVSLFENTSEEFIRNGAQLYINWKDVTVGGYDLMSYNDTIREAFYQQIDPLYNKYQAYIIEDMLEELQSNYLDKFRYPTDSTMLGYLCCATDYTDEFIASVNITGEDVLLLQLGHLEFGKGSIFSDESSYIQWYIKKDKLKQRKFQDVMCEYTR